jgi:hypothetical protein
LPLRLHQVLLCCCVDCLALVRTQLGIGHLGHSVAAGHFKRPLVNAEALFFVCYDAMLFELAMSSLYSSAY